jgi:hypothetical protein
MAKMIQLVIVTENGNTWYFNETSVFANGKVHDRFEMQLEYEGYYVEV